MTKIAVLFVLGVVFLGMEMFLPGGILGLFAALALLGGCVLACVNYGMGGGLVAVIAALLLVGVMLYFEFAIVPKTPMGKRLFLNTASAGRSAPMREKDFVGSAGETATDLAPTGYVLIEGHRHEAFSRTGFLKAGEPVTVIAVDTFRLIVIPKS
ncbi:MAG: serine protease [Candidatus Synoicihabitans palmerolidicus]|nr:serine protease [Candidatus Synoicihabitans palmerolidicus]